MVVHDDDADDNADDVDNADDTDGFYHRPGFKLGASSFILASFKSKNLAKFLPKFARPKRLFCKSLTKFMF